MLAAQVHRDRARAEHTVNNNAPRRTSHHVKGRRKGSGGGGQPSFDNDRAQTFMANRDAAAATISGPSGRHRGSVALGATKRKRSSVVAIVKKRVEMLHMNVIAREFSQVVVRRATALKFHTYNTQRDFENGLLIVSYYTV